MTAQFPDRRTIETALSLATRAPLLHGAGVGWWRVCERSLHLFADGDGDDRGALLSCGASLNHCVVALAALGWCAEVRRFPDPAAPEHVAALKLRPHSGTALETVLAASIPRRCSDWRPYSSWAVSAADLALISARAANVGVTTRRAEAVPDVQRVVAQAILARQSDYDPPETTGRNGKGMFLADAVQHYTDEENAEVLVLGTKDDSPHSRLRAGEAASLMLLSATALGLASCPVAEPLQSAETRDALQSALFGLVGVPQMLVRIGWPRVGADPLPSPPPRPVAEVCEWVGRETLSSA